MRIKVKDLKQNPYRNLERYKIDPYKVDALATSIKETSFWDNILARPADGGYELAYGHHRLLAIQKVGLKYINIPIRELDDATMIKIMANENLDEWKLNPIVLNESVRVAKEFLKTEFRKYNEISRLPSVYLKLDILIHKKIKSIKDLDDKSWGRMKSQGPGADTILSFLGGNWSRSKISEALAQLKESKEMREAEETFDTQTEAQEFRKAVKQIDEEHKKKGVKIPEKKKKETAKKVAKSRKKKKGKKIAGEKTDRHDYRRDIRTETRMELEGISETKARMKDIELEFKRFYDRVRSAYIGSRDLNIILQKLNVEEIKGIQALFILDNVSDLLREIKVTLKFFGYDYKHLQLGG